MAKHEVPSTLPRYHRLVVTACSQLLEWHEAGSNGHHSHVGKLAAALGTEIALEEKEDAVGLALGALLHDVGKISIPVEILLKPGALDSRERRIMERHTTNGWQLLRFLPGFGNAAQISRFHHEKWDGSGYPLGLKKTKIPLAARILAVADVYDALISKRPYKRAWPREEAISYVVANSGSHFDPVVVSVFLRLPLQETDPLQNF